MCVSRQCFCRFQKKKSRDYDKIFDRKSSDLNLTDQSFRWRQNKWKILAEHEVMHKSPNKGSFQFPITVMIVFGGCVWGVWGVLWLYLMCLMCLMTVFDVFHVFDDSLVYLFNVLMCLICLTIVFDLCLMCLMTVYLFDVLMCFTVRVWWFCLVTSFDTFENSFGVFEWWIWCVMIVFYVKKTTGFSAF